MIKKTISIVALLLLLSDIALAVTPKSLSIVHSKNVTLSDVFDGITSNQSYILAPSPEMGESLVLNSQDLSRISRAFNLNWYPTGSFDQVVIKTSANLVSKSKILKTIKSEIRLNDIMATKSFTLEFSNSDIEMFVPGEESPTLKIDDLDVDFNSNSFTARLSASNKNSTIAKNLSGHIKYLVAVPVLNRRIDRGGIIDKYDITMIEVTASQIGNNVITNQENLIGMTPKQALDPMKQIKTGSVQPPLMIKKGDLITLNLKKGSINLTAQGKALNRGSYGDFIRVQNTSSNIIIDGIITAPKQVTVNMFENL